MGKKLDLTNKRFGFWIVLEPLEKNKQGKTQWLCQCECGIKRAITTNSLRTGNSTSCGCNHVPDLTNQKFGYLTVLKLDESKNKGRRFWICKCKCDNTVSVSTYQLRNNIIKHCGCIIDPLLISEHPDNCNCSRESSTREDTMYPNSIYSPNHMNFSQRYMQNFVNFQKNVLNLEKTIKKTRDIFSI